MINVLTVDVEDWYQTNGLDLDIESWHQYEDRVRESTMRILRILDQYQVKATFFILGCVAEKDPQLVLEIAQRGHEIGSHGGWHQLLTRLTLEEFRVDLLYSKRILEEITGYPVKLFRAPSWSISAGRYEVLEILCEEGFTCDSSLQPFSTPLSGIANAPHEPFYPVLKEKALDMLEFPSTVLKLGKLSIPFSGGFYLRALPYPLVAWALRRVNRERSGMVYVHPWEFDPSQPRIKISPFVKIIQYYNLHTTEQKLHKLLQQFCFAPMSQVTANRSFPVVKL